MGKKFYGLDEAGFTRDYLPEEPTRLGEKVACRCPRCSDYRKKKSDKCAQITKVADGWVWCCHQPECDGGKGEFISEKSKDDESREWQAEKARQRANQGGAQQKPTVQVLAPIEAKVRPQQVEPCKAYSKQFLQYWDSRGISEGTLRKTGTNEIAHYVPAAGGVVPCAQFPITYKGELVAYKYRSMLTKDFAISKGAELAFYNFDWIDEANKAKKKIKVCYIVEGEIDLLSFVECGINAVISVPNGASGGSYLDKYFADKSFDNVEQFIMATDNDAAGIKFRDDFVRRVGLARCRFAQYAQHPTEDRECKDPNELLMNFGAGALVNLELQKISVAGVQLVSDVKDRLQVVRDEGYSPYYKIGIEDLDSVFTWALSAQLTVVSAAPNSAKSDFIFNVAIRLAVFHGAKVGIMTPETGDAADTYAALARIYMGQHYTKKPQGMPLGSQITIASDSEVQACLEFIRKHFFIYNCEEETINTDRFLEIGEQLVSCYGVNMLVCDPYNFLSDAFTPEKGDAMMSEHLNSNLQRIKHFAQSKDIHAVLIPHPKQMTPFERMIDFGQINGGAAWGNKADNVLFLNRLYKGALDQYNELVRARGTKSDADDMNCDLGDYVEVVVRKVKKSFAGRRAEIRLAYELTTGRFGQASTELPAVFLGGAQLWQAARGIDIGGDNLDGIEQAMQLNNMWNK